jgi:DNA (cytosine-5)-methyltransferase 1
MQIIDLFSGIGGFSVAGHSLGWETVLFCEKEPFPQQVLRERFLGVPIFDDVCKLTGEDINGLIQPDKPTILTAGIPCQPFSVAGSREGANDSRHLWPQCFRIIKEVRPDWVLIENVPGLATILFEPDYTEMDGEATNSILQSNLPIFNEPAKRDKMEIEFKIIQKRILGEIIENLQSAGYSFPETQDGTPGVFCIPACATGAPHRRDRVWIVAYNTGKRWSEGFRPETNISERRMEKLGQEWGGTRNDLGTSGKGTTSQNSESSGCHDGEYEQQGGFGEFEELGTGSHERDISREDAGVTTDTSIQGHQGSEQPGTHGERPEPGEPHRPTSELHSGNYWADWPSISPFHTGHDGLSEELVRHIRTSLSEAGQTPEQIEAYLRKESNWLRKEAIKCAGNAIVPQVVLEVMKSIQNHYEQHGK